MLRQVKTENGWVKGIEAADPRITAFKGIPFAAPPVGKNSLRHTLIPAGEAASNIKERPLWLRHRK